MTRSLLRLGALQYLDQAGSVLSAGVATGFMVALSMDSLAYSAQRREGRRDEHPSREEVSDHAMYIGEDWREHTVTFFACRTLVVDNTIPATTAAAYPLRTIDTSRALSPRH